MGKGTNSNWREMKRMGAVGNEARGGGEGPAMRGTGEEEMKG